jgi:hypothetical protein
MASAAIHGNDIPPFWSRIPAFFLYALKPLPLLLAAVSGILIYLTSSFWVTLILYAVAVKYSMASLQHTMRGELSPPPLNGRVLIQGYELPLFLFFILLLYIMALGAIAGSVSGILALLLYLAGLLLFPALIMCLGISESFGFSINPIHWMSLVRAIGWPYLALYGLYLSFSGVEATLQYFLLDKIGPEMRAPVWMLINTLFMIISFHMLGYVILQYHRELDTPTPLGADDSDSLTTPLLDKFIREGNSAAALEELRALVKEHPEDADLRKKLHNYAMLNRQFDVVTRHAAGYMGMLTRMGKHSEAAQLFSDCMASGTPCHPDRPEAYLPIFEVLKQRRERKNAVALTKGFHKRFPGSDYTPSLYLELARLFSEEMQRDDLAQKLLQFLLDQYSDHEKLPEVRRYLNLIENLANPS